MFTDLEYLIFVCTVYRGDVTIREMICPFCKISVEKEVHLVLCGPGLDDLRRRHIQPKYLNFPSDFRLTLLFIV